jgi:hypothetical protein
MATLETALAGHMFCSGRAGLERQHGKISADRSGRGFFARRDFAGGGKNQKRGRDASQSFTSKASMSRSRHRSVSRLVRLPSRAASRSGLHLRSHENAGAVTPAERRCCCFPVLFCLS